MSDENKNTAIKQLITSIIELLRKWEDKMSRTELESYKILLKTDPKTLLSQYIAGNRGLDSVNERDITKKDPSFATERNAYFKLISEVETSLMVHYIPMLKEINDLFKKNDHDAQICNEIEIILNNAKKMNMMVITDKTEKPSFLRDAYLTPTDVGQMKECIKHQFTDIRNSMKLIELEQIESTPDRITVLTKEEVSNKVILMRYVPFIEKQNIEGEMKAFHYDLLKKRNEWNSVQGFFLTLSDNKSNLPEIQAIADVNIYNYGLKEIVDILSHSGTIVPPSKVQEITEKNDFLASAISLILHNGKYYWLVFSIDQKRFTLFDNLGKPIELSSVHDLSEKIRFKVGENPEERFINLIQVSHSVEHLPRTSIAIKLVKSTEWMDYKSPSHPDYFIGRYKEIKEFFNKISDIQRNKYPGRGIAIIGSSGTGKSSFILKLQSLTKDFNKNLFIYCIDSRGCYGPDFVSVIFTEFLESICAMKPDMKWLLDIPHSKFDIPSISRMLNGPLIKEGFSAIIIFDQFEYLVAYPNVVTEIVNLQTSLESYNANIIIGYVLRTDMNLPRFPHFPFDVWSRIQKQTWNLQLGTLRINEEKELISQIHKSIGRGFSQNLISEIIKFSKGRPWILKRIGSHLVEKYGRRPNHQLKLELRLDELFEQDVTSLQDQEISVLKMVAKLGPASFDEIKSNLNMSENEISGTFNNLVDLRLIIRIGQKYDTYHDRFKEYVLEALSNPDDKLRLEADSILRAAKAMPNRGLEFLLLTIALPPMVVSSHTNENLRKEICLMMADEFLKLGDEEMVAVDINNPSLKALLNSYTIFSVLKSDMGDHEISEKQHQVIEKMFRQRNLDVKEIFSILEYKDLIYALNYMRKIYPESKDNFIREKIMASIYSNDIKETSKLISELQPEERVLYYTEMINSLLVRGEFDNACKVQNQMDENHKQIIVDIKSTLDLLKNEDGSLQDSAAVILIGRYKKTEELNGVPKLPDRVDNVYDLKSVENNYDKVLNWLDAYIKGTEFYARMSISKRFLASRKAKNVVTYINRVLQFAPVEKYNYQRRFIDTVPVSEVETVDRGIQHGIDATTRYTIDYFKELCYYASLGFARNNQKEEALNLLNYLNYRDAITICHLIDQKNIISTLTPENRYIDPYNPNEIDQKEIEQFSESLSLLLSNKLQLAENRFKEIKMQYLINDLCLEAMRTLLELGEIESAKKITELMVSAFKLEAVTKISRTETLPLSWSHKVAIQMEQVFK